MKKNNYRRRRKKPNIYIIILLGAMIAFSIIAFTKIVYPTNPYRIEQLIGKEITTIQEVSSLTQAKAIMQRNIDYKQNKNARVLDENNKIVAIGYGVVNFRTKDCKINTSYKTNKKKKGYLNGCYGSDGIYLGSNDDGTKVKFQIADVIGWVPTKEIELVAYQKGVITPSHYQVKEGSLYHFISTDLTTVPSYSLDLGTVALKDGVYYSYDGHYFYDNFYTLTEDVKNNRHTNSVNEKNPFTFYYQFVSHATLSNYTAKDIDKYISNHLGFSSKEASLLYQSGNDFMVAQKKYQVNAVMILSLAINESDYGRSAIARSKLNLFGHAAYDQSPSKSANRYVSIGESIETHANVYLKNGYLNKKDNRYHGPFFGNKAEGMNVMYASDPYWGEKAAANYREFDQIMGGKDRALNK